MVRVNLHEKRGRQFKVTKKLFTIIATQDLLIHSTSV